MKLEMGNISLKKTLNQRETIMLLATLLVGFIGYYKSCAMPVQEKLFRAREAIVAQTGERERLMRQISSKKLESPIKEEKERQWLAQRSSIEPSIQALVNPIHLLGVRIKDFSSSESKAKEDPFPKRKISLVASGDMAHLGRYIEYIENLEAPLVIEALAIVPDGNKPGEQILKIEGGFYAAP